MKVKLIFEGARGLGRDALIGYEFNVSDAVTLSGSEVGRHIDGKYIVVCDINYVYPRNNDFNETLEHVKIDNYIKLI